jgi:adenylate cyclase
MPTLTYLSDKKQIEALADETLLEASLRHDIPHTHVCGGKARCSTCRVMIVEGLQYCAPRNSREQQLAERLHLGPEIRLACQTTVTGDITLRRLVLDFEDIELTSQLTADKSSISVGEDKKIAILFADIRNFTTFSEALPPYDVIHVLNRYFAQMDKVIHQHGGYINNYMGDGLLALFGVDDPGHAALNAVHAGLGMLEAVEKLKVYLQGVYGMSFNIGIGVHYGEVVLGSVGGQSQRRMTAIGDAVNFASRVEEANKEFGTRLLISEAAYAEAGGHFVTDGIFEQVVLKGKSGQYRLYEIIGSDGT